ncbi:MAG: TrbG/VirB9 family P-type conjugative transfer protein [Proteobacteria bacterium]|nr:TrbG/VirB9 family P-type conjugative transfer protein [Pseudomonadota bacterium]
MKCQLAVIGILCAGTALAETNPEPGLLDSRVRSAPYSADEVYRLAGFVGYQTDLEFEAGENFVGLGAGDIEGLSFVAAENHLFLKPKAAKVGTNLTILTNRRTYQLDYAASVQRPDASEPVTYVLRFTYPPASGATEAAVHELDKPTSRPKNIDYWFCGDPTLKPTAAFDDGVHTRITFAPKAEQPAIFVLNEDGSESLLNFSMEERDVIVHRVARRLILRRGNLAACIVNKGFTGSGDALKSRTVAGGIERTTKGERP